MDEDFKEVEGEAVNVPPYWPPDEAMRLEYLRLAAGRVTPEKTVDLAKEFYAFVKGSTE